MARFTIVYTDGYEEHYVIKGHKPDDSMQMHHFKQLIENDILKLILEGEQLVLIPMANIRKIIFQSAELMQEEKEFPGFIHVGIDGMND